MKTNRWVGLLTSLAGLALLPLLARAETRECPTFPPEHEKIRDKETGAELVFVTSSPQSDTNLYFHQNSFLPDGSLLVFVTARNGSPELFGYLPDTGELVRLGDPGRSISTLATCARKASSVYVIEGRELKQWDLHIASAGAQAPRVTLEDRALWTLPEEASGVVGLNEDADGRHVVVGYYFQNREGGRIVSVDRETGEVATIAEIPWQFGHIQSSWETPGLVMFCQNGPSGDRSARFPDGRLSQRMWLADLTEKEPWPLYKKVEGELVTHECWWTGDRVTFCSGLNHEGKAEEAHVKVVDIESQTARIIGAGAWWPGGSPEEIAARNWWHCAGSPDGRWVAADNWHGTVALFSGKTARTKLLTVGHRIYGQGEHPHVGWHLGSRQVVFASNLRGNPDVCLASIPEDWDPDW